MGAPRAFADLPSGPHARLLARSEGRTQLQPLGRGPGRRRRRTGRAAGGLIAIAQARVPRRRPRRLSLTAATGLSGTILGLVRSMNNLEVELQSFDRVWRYSDLEPEENNESET